MALVFNINIGGLGKFINWVNGKARPYMKRTKYGKRIRFFLRKTLIYVWIVRNILADGEVQKIKEIVQIAKSMWASEKSKFIAFKIIKKGLKSMKRQKFKKNFNSSRL